MGGSGKDLRIVVLFKKECSFSGTDNIRLLVKALRNVSGRLHMVLNVFLACRVPWVSAMATGVTINY